MQKLDPRRLTLKPFHVLDARWALLVVSLF